jgi:colanic acid/amylovoran biosynthesis glycosyltransferase
MALSSSPTVALFATEFLPYSQTFIHDELRAHERYTAHVFCKVRKNPERFPYAAWFAPPSWATTLYENVAYWPSFDRRIGAGHYDLIHAHFGTGAVYALPYALRHDIPLVITFWGNDVSALIGSQRYKPTRWRYLAYSTFLFRHADLMLGVSEELCELLRELSGRPEAVRYYTHGIDLDRFQPLADRPRRDVPQVVMVGRFAEKKGHRYALQAFDRVVRSGRQAHLTFVGDGTLRTWCERYVQAHDLSDAVTFAGVLTAEETAAQLAQADVALVPSVVAHNHDREGSPTVAKEASACGVPVIATWHAGLPEIVDDGETGFLVPERNVPALADRLATLLDDASLRQRFGREARAKMERSFDLHTQVQKLERLYDAVRRSPAAP